MYVFMYCFIVLLVFTNLKSFIRIMRTMKFLNRKYENNSHNKDKFSIKVIIPAMNEVNNVEKSVKYFKDLSNYCEVIYVTTSKEIDKATYKTIKNMIKKYKTKNIRVVNCPNTYGTMANQINYACKQLNSNDIIALYNIDSFPERETFDYVVNNITNTNVLQQVSYFDDKCNLILKSAQNWQNRWSLIYEMGRYLKKSNFIFKYTIGHGLFIKKELIDKYGYWSEEEINEDNELGYRLMINGIDIEPIPYLEKADFAKLLKIYIKQQSTWVNGPLYAFSYYKKHDKTMRNFVLSLLNFKAFLSWWLFPLFTLFFIFISAFYSINLLIIGLLLIIIYISGFNFLCSYILKKHNYYSYTSFPNILSDLIFFIVHSFGSWITIYKIICNKNNIKNKYNTEK